MKRCVNKNYLMVNIDGRGVAKEDLPCRCEDPPSLPAAAAPAPSAAWREQDDVLAI